MLQQGVEIVVNAGVPGRQLAVPFLPRNEGGAPSPGCCGSRGDGYRRPLGQSRERACWSCSWSKGGNGGCGQDWRIGNLGCKNFLAGQQSNSNHATPQLVTNCGHERKKSHPLSRAKRSQWKNKLQQIGLAGHVLQMFAVLPTTRCNIPPR